MYYWGKNVMGYPIWNTHTIPVKELWNSSLSYVWIKIAKISYQKCFKNLWSFGVETYVTTMSIKFRTTCAIHL